MTNQDSDIREKKDSKQGERSDQPSSSQPIPYSQWKSNPPSTINDDSSAIDPTDATAPFEGSSDSEKNEPYGQEIIDTNDQNAANDDKPISDSATIISNILEQERNAQQFNRGGHIELMLTEEQEKDFKKARTFSSAAMICAVVSLFIGGMFLSAVGLGCAYASYRRVKKHVNASGNVGMFARAMKRTAVTSAMFCGFSFGLNAFAAWQMMPYLTDMLNSGSISLPGSEATVPQNSTWG